MVNFISNFTVSLCLYYFLTLQSTVHSHVIKSHCIATLYCSLGAIAPCYDLNFGVLRVNLSEYIGHY
jgi:hypothetical protein